MDIGTRLRQELEHLALSPAPGADAAQVAVSKAKVAAILAWLMPQVDLFLATAHELNGPFIVSTELHGGLDPGELDYHLVASLFVLLGRLVDTGMLALPPADL